MDKKTNPIILYILGIVALIAMIIYGVYFKVSGTLEFQASLQTIAEEVSSNKQLASEAVSIAIEDHKKFLKTVEGDFDKYYLQNFEKNQFVRTFDELISQISTEQAPLVVNSLNISAPIRSVSGGVESIPISISITTNKQSLLSLVQKLESVGLDRSNPFYLMELQSLSFQVPEDEDEDEELPEISTTLNFSISKTLSTNG